MLLAMRFAKGDGHALCLWNAADHKPAGHVCRTRALVHISGTVRAGTASHCGR